MAIPFFGIVFHFSTVEDDERFNLNPEYRMERTRHQALSLTRIYIYEKIGIFEKNICRPNYEEIVAVVIDGSKNIESGELKKLPVQNAKLMSVNKDSIGIEYQILGKRKVIFHKLNNSDGY